MLGNKKGLPFVWQALSLGLGEYGFKPIPATGMNSYGDDGV
jgi:hypothetical protein